MTPISERLRFRAEVKGNGDLAVGRRPPTYGKESELEWKAADTIDALTEALVEAREQITILQDRLGIRDTGHGTLSIIDAALTLSKESNHE